MADLASQNGILLANLEDGISSLHFFESLLVAGCWDKKVHLFDTQSQVEKASFSTEGAVLDVRICSKTQIFCGGLDKQVKR